MKLEVILKAYPDQLILLFWDRAPWHTSVAVPAFLQQAWRMEVVPFPVGAPDLNPQEHGWKLVRRAVEYHRENRRHVVVRAGADGVHRAEFGVQHLLIAQKQGGQGLVVRGRRNMFISCQMGQKGLHFSAAHLIGVPFGVEEDRSFDPLHIGSFSTDRSVFQAHGGTYLVEKFWSGHGISPIDGWAARVYNKLNIRDARSARAFRNASLSGE